MYICIYIYIYILTYIYLYLYILYMSISLYLYTHTHTYINRPGPRVIPRVSLADRPYIPSAPASLSHSPARALCAAQCAGADGEMGVAPHSDSLAPASSGVGVGAATVQLTVQYASESLAPESQAPVDD